MRGGFAPPLINWLHWVINTFKMYTLRYIREGLLKRDIFVGRVVGIWTTIIYTQYKIIYIYVTNYVTTRYKAILSRIILSATRGKEYLTHIIKYEKIIL